MKRSLLLACGAIICAGALGAGLASCRTGGEAVTEAASSSAASSTAPSAPAVAIEAELQQVIADVEEEFQVQAGVALDGQGGTVSAGLPGEEPAFSTLKVPIAIAALRDGASEDIVDLAITQSDNDAAYALWMQVGWQEGDAVAAVGELLEHYGSHAQLQDPFGFSTWLLADQAIFGAQLPCMSEAEYVWGAMDEVVDWQSNGLTALPDTRAKGGWGVDETTGMYTHRQFGARTIGGGTVGVAIEVLLDGDDHDNAEPALGAVAKGVDAVLTHAVEEGALAPHSECVAKEAVPATEPATMPTAVPAAQPGEG